MKYKSCFTADHSEWSFLSSLVARDVVNPQAGRSSASKRNSRPRDKETRITAPARPAIRQPNRLAKFRRDDSRRITWRLNGTSEDRSHSHTFLHQVRE